jgi:hypothetical protein
VASPASRGELVRRFVLDVICDDYENLTVSIAEPVKQWGAACGLTIETSEVVQALTELVELGWAKAWRLSEWSQPPAEFANVPSLQEMEDPSGAWFYITDAGMKVQLAEYDGWPFDKTGALRKDWTPPEN